MIVDSPNLARLESLDISNALGHAPWLGGQTRDPEMRMGDLVTEL